MCSRKTESAIPTCRHVFIVTSDAELDRELGATLATLGHVHCGTAKATAEALASHDAKTADVILVDAELASRASASELSASLRVPAVLLERAAGASDLGGLPSIARPFDTRVLAATVELALARNEASERDRVLRLTQRIAEIGSWEWDLPSGTVRWSDEMCRLHGVDPKTFRPTPDSVFAHYTDEDAARLRERMLEATRPTHVQLGVYRVLLPDGTSRSHWVSWQTERDPAGKPLRIVGVNLDVSERLDHEARLELAQFTIENASDAFHFVGPDGRLLDVNAAACDLLGYTREELLRLTVFDITPGISREEWPAHWEDLRARGRIAFEGAARHKSGELVSVEVRLHFLRFRGREYNVVVARDITGRRRGEAALRIASADLPRRAGQSFFDAMAAQLATLLDADAAIITVVTEPGRARTKALYVDGRLLAPRSIDVSGTPCERAPAGDVRFHAEGVREAFPRATLLAEIGASGFAGMPLTDGDGRIIGNISVVSRKRFEDADLVTSTVGLFAISAGAELARQRVEQRFEGVFEFAPDGLLIVDTGGRILQSNRLAETIFGYGRGELDGQEVEMLVPAPARANHPEHVAGFVAAGERRVMGWERSRVTGLRKDGSIIPIEISLGPMFSEHGRYVIAAVRDVSERVRAEQERAALEEQLRHAQKLESLGTLAGGIAHDFNNLLTIILGGTALAREELTPASAAAAHLDDVETASRRARDLVRQILAFSRQQPMQRTVVELGAVVREAGRLLRATLPASIQIVVETDGAPAVLADASQLHQVVMNLATNAWHAIEPAHGTILVALDGVTADGEGRYARLRVRDDGRGMDAKVVERIFEPFFTTKGVGKGTGLGLAVVHGIISDHGGTIRVDSVPGSGTTFTIHLPAATDVPRAISAAPATSDRASSGRVLFVDDEPMLVRIGVHLLRRLGFEVTGFVDPVDALEALRRAPDAFDVVLSDLNMPRLSGKELAGAIAEIRPDLPVVLVSGFGQRGRDGLGENVRSTVDKPYSSASLAEALAAARASEGGT